MLRLLSSRAAHAFVCALTAFLMSAGFAAAGNLPEWISAKPQAKLVVLAMDAGVGDNNGGLNFNGHHEGHNRIVVPQGWTVIVRMRNADSRVPHSALVTRVYRQEEMPDRLSPSDAVFPGAATAVPHTGTAAGGYADSPSRPTRPGNTSCRAACIRTCRPACGSPSTSSTDCPRRSGAPTDRLLARCGRHETEWRGQCPAIFFCAIAAWGTRAGRTGVIRGMDQERIFPLYRVVQSIPADRSQSRLS